MINSDVFDEEEAFRSEQIEEPIMGLKNSTLTILDSFKANIGEEELVKMICGHARNKSATLSKPYLFYLAGLYGVGEDGGIGHRVESTFIGLDKDETLYERG